jgi:hypothetical protein
VVNSTETPARKFTVPRNTGGIVEKYLKNMEKITQVMKCFMCNKKKEDFGLNGRLWT